MAKLNLGRVGIVPQGNYDNTKTYIKMDMVYYPTTGSSYVSLVDNNTALPTDSTKWQSAADVSNEVAAANAAAARANTAAEAAEAVSDEVAELKSDVNGLTRILEANGTIIHQYVLHKVIENATVNSSGMMVSGETGKNAYVYQVSPGAQLIGTGGSVYGLFATDPVKQTVSEDGTITIDGTRHVGTLNNTLITIPTGANYLSITNVSDPSVLSATVKTTSEIVSELVEIVDDISNDVDELNDLENKLVEDGTVRQKIASGNVFAASTVNSSGVIVNGPTGSDINVFIFQVSPAMSLLATGGSLYAFYEINPTKNETQSTDQTRHVVGTLNKTQITIPEGAYYLAIANTAEPTVEINTQTVSEKVQILEREMENALSVIGTPLSFSESGFINATYGTFVSNEAYKSTDYIPLTANGTYLPIKYRVKGLNSTGFAFYDGQQKLIKTIPIGSGSSLEEIIGVLDYVSGAVYVRLCTYVGTNSSNAYTDYYAKYASMKNTVTGIIPYPTDYQGSEIGVFNKILCIGDSLTAGTFNYRVDSSISNYVEDAKYSYPTFLKKLTGCNTTNMGNGGKTSLEWYQLHANDDLSGYDCAIIQLGVNDVGRYTTWGQDSIDGFTGIIDKLKNENKNIKIFVANIIPARFYHTEAYLNMSAAISAFITGLNDPQVILLNMQQYGHTYDSDAYNCGHLSALGYWRLAQDYKSYISWYIFMNKTDFKEVQFIGTDYYYDPIN